MHCLVQGCEASEKMLEEGVDVYFTINGEVGRGRVCRPHTQLVASNGYTGYSVKPPLLVPVPKDLTAL